ncbi:MAG: hypothetical protein FJX77_08730, partial [Armatimonadetes bacterium]|nr:hypothetical protein [Armatimonadota bacterium]
MPQPPHLLLILLDSAQAHFYGHAGGPVHTPHADRLAARGTRFRRAYCAAPICHPARSLIETGLFPHANGMLTNRCGRGAYPFSVFPQVPGLAEQLRSHGYRTGYAGQGHIDVRGFDDDASYPTAEFHAWLRAQGREERPHPEHRCWGGGLLDGDAELARDTQFALRAVDLLVRYASLSDQPWFLQCDFDGPHPPCWPPAPFLDRYPPGGVALPASLRDPLEDVPPAVRQARDSQGGLGRTDDEWRTAIAHFYAMTEFLDTLVGRVLTTLARLRLANQTVVVLSSDHGGLMGAHGFVIHGSPALYDPAVRTPLLIAGPGIPAGRVEEAFVSHADLVPTLLELADCPAPEGSGHGRSLAPFLRGEVPPDWRDDVYCQYSGDGVQFYSVRAVRSERWSYTFAPHGGEQLYDLTADPEERRNRASAAAPDPASRAGLREMRRRLAAWMERVDDPLR